MGFGLLPKTLQENQHYFFSLGTSGVRPVIIYKLGKNGFKYNPSHKLNGLRKALQLKSFKDFKILNLSILNATCNLFFLLHIYFS